MLLFAPLMMYAQLDEEGAYKVDYDTNYIRDYRHRLSVALIVDFRRNDLAIFRENDKALHYTTNLPRPTYGIMFSYRWANLSLSFPIDNLSSYDEDYSKTDGFGLGLGITGRKLYFRNFYEDTKGYQLQNPEAADPDYWSKFDLLPDYENLRQRTYFATLYYGFNGRRYSQRDLLYQSETQLKGSGTFMAGLNGGYKWIDSDKDITRDDFSTINVPKNDDILEMEYATIGIAAGYAHTFVLPWNLNFSGLLIPALNYTSGDYTTRDGRSTPFSSDMGLNAELRFQLAYNSGGFYAGVAYSTYGLSSFFNEDAAFTTFHNLLRFNLGYHFHLKPIKGLKPFGLSN